MQRLIQKLLQSISVLALALGVLVPSVAAAPTTAGDVIQLQPAGTCFVHQLGTPVRYGSCQSLGFTTDMFDSTGKHLDYKNCYDISSTTSKTTINQSACDDTSLTGPVVMCDQNGKTVECPPDTSDPAVSSGNCSSVNHCDLIGKYINPLINLVAALVGIGVVISIVIAGIQYGSSAGDAQKVSAAKARIRNAVIALATFIFLYTLLNFLIPGGLGLI